MENKWFIVYTKAGAEKKVTEVLAKKGVESYSTSQQFVHQKTHHNTVRPPLLKSYVFVKCSDHLLPQVKHITGVINLVYWLNTPVTVTDAEIQYLKHFLNANMNVFIKKTNSIQPGDRGFSTNNRGEDTSYQYNNITKMASLILPSLGFILYGETRLSHTPASRSESFVSQVKSFNNKFSFSGWLAGN